VNKVENYEMASLAAWFLRCEKRDKKALILITVVAP